MRLLRTGLSLAVLAAMTVQASAACDGNDAAALKTAAVQQELMVAGLICGDTSAYNRFVLDYQPELQKSDAGLMAYFRSRDGSEAGYDSYKTKLANLAAGKAAADGARYCASMAREFSVAATQDQTLAHFISADHLLIAAPEACAVQYDMDMRVAGVPEHELPAAPFGAPTEIPTPAAAPAKSHSAPPLAASGLREAYNDLPKPPRYAPQPSDADWQAVYADGPLPMRRRSRYSAYDND